MALPPFKRYLDKKYKIIHHAALFWRCVRGRAAVTERRIRWLSLRAHLIIYTRIDGDLPSCGAF